MFYLKIKSYFVRLCNKTCGTTRYRIEGFDLNLHTDSEFALPDTGRCDRKKIIHDLTNDNFSVLFFYFINRKTDRKKLKLTEE